MGWLVTMWLGAVNGLAMPNALGSSLKALNSSQKRGAPMFSEIIANQLSMDID
jgi:hypothetical protein